MNNSAISRYNSSKLNKKLSQYGIQKNTKTIHSFQQYLQSKQQHSQHKQSLFTPFKKQSIKNNSNLQQQRQNKSFQSTNHKPIFSGFRNDDKPHSYNIDYGDQKSNKQNNYEKVSNDLIKTKHTLKQSLDNSLNQSLNRSEIQVNKNQQIQLNNFQNRNLFFRKKNKNQLLIFGQGLQEIGTQNQNSYLNQAENRQFDRRISRQSFHSVKNIKSSSLIQANQKIKKQKRLSYRPVADTDFRSTGRSFFKRPASSSLSQQYFKSYIKDYSKGQRRESILNGKLISNSSNQRQQRESVFLKTQPISLSKFQDSQNIENIKTQRNYLSISNNINRLVFKYSGGHATMLYNYKLKIKNESQVILGVKIQCTSPRHYQVRPFNNTLLQPQQILSLSIEMKLYPHDLDPISMKHDLARYKNDKFKILSWNAQTFNDSDFYQEQRILPVIIQQTQQLKLRNQGMQKNLNEQRTKQTTKENEIQMYKKFMQKNTQKMNQVDIKITKIQSLKYKHQYMTFPLFVLIIILGFLIGFWLG